MGIRMVGDKRLTRLLRTTAARAPALAQEATLAGARVLQRAQKRHAPVDTGRYRASIVIRKSRRHGHRVTVPRRRFPARFFYPILFLKLWNRINRRYRRRAIAVMRRILKRRL